MFSRQKVIFLIITLLGAFSLVANVTLVNKGKPAAEIILARNANRSCQLAARDLQHFVKIMSGAKLPIINSPSKKAVCRIFIGNSTYSRASGFKATEFKKSGYEIVVKNNSLFLNGRDYHSKPNPFGRLPWKENLYLRPFCNNPRPKKFPSAGLKKWQNFCGEKFTTLLLYNGASIFCPSMKIFFNDDTGTWYAAIALLERLGVRFYAPYADGTVIPKRKTIKLVDMYIKKVADFSHREFTYYNAMRQDHDGVTWLKRLKGGNCNLILLNHTTYGIYSSREQLTLHPEYFAQSAPAKYFTGYPLGSGVPRLSNLAFRHACVKWMNKVFTAFPDLKAISVGIPDGTKLEIDYRDIPQYKNTFQGKVNYIWEFHEYLATELKKTHPDKKLLLFFWLNDKLLPSNVKKAIPSNIIKVFCEVYSSTKLTGSKRSEMLKNRKKWLAFIKQKDKSVVWDYFLYYRPETPRYPILFPHALQQEMQEMFDYADGKFIELMPEWKATGQRTPQNQKIGTIPLMNLMIYVQQKLFWDRNLDINALLAEYYELFFGPAAPEMAKFHSFAEAVWMRSAPRTITANQGFLKEKDIKQYFKLLTQAKQKVSVDSAYFRRINAIEKEMAPLKNLFANLRSSGHKLKIGILPKNSKLDGNLSKYSNWQLMKKNCDASPAPKGFETQVSIMLSADGKELRIGAICNDANIKHIKAHCVKADDFSIFRDDVLEVYVNTPTHRYSKIVVNTNGKIYDETRDSETVAKATLPILWSPGCRAVIKKEATRWLAEIAIPTNDFGNKQPWGIQVGRTCFTARPPVTLSIAPTGGIYAKQDKWARGTFDNSNIQ